MARHAPVRNNFPVRPLALAVAVALVAPAAFADNGMPGAGLVVRNMGNVVVNGTVLPGGDQILGLTNGATIQNTNIAPAVTAIQWGSPAVLDSTNKAGFHLATGKTLTFDSTFGSAAFLNIDLSGSLSTIDGTLIATPGTYLVIANEKGITVGSGATITAPQSLALVGANLNTIDAIDSYIGGIIKMNFAPGAPVTVAGNLSAVGNFLLVAGSDAVNLGGKAPSGATTQIAVVGGVGGSYNSSFPAFTPSDKGPVDSVNTFSSAPANVTLTYGTALAPFDASAAGHNLLAYANGDLTNTGYIDFKLDGPSALSHVQWTGTLVNTGTMATLSAATDFGFNATIPADVSWYNNSKTTLAQFGGINNSGAMGASDGSATVVSHNGNLVNSGAIVAKNNVGVAAQIGNVSNTGLIVAATGLAVLEAGQVGVPTPAHSITNSGTIAAAGKVSIESYWGDVTNTTSGVISGASVTLVANYANKGASGSAITNGTVNITSKGGSAEFRSAGTGDVYVGGTVAASGTGNYIGYFSASHESGGGISTKGTVTVATPITVKHDITTDGIYVAGDKIVVNAPLTVVEATTGTGAGQIEFYGTNALGINDTKINANLIAGEFLFETVAGGGLGGAFDMNVALNGNLTTTAGGARVVEMYQVGNVQGPGVITANNVVIDASGSVNNVTSNNFLFNGLHITTVGSDPIVTFNARGAGRQAINLAITGDATVTSGDTVANFNPCFNGLCTPGGYIPQPNAESSLIVQATGNLTVGPNNYAGTLYSGSYGGLSQTNGFLFPGGVTFIAGNTLNVNTIVDNAFTGSAVPFQGQYYEAKTINALLPMYTNGNSWVNFSVLPNGGSFIPTAYGSKAGLNFLGFPNLTAVLNPLAQHLNTYSVLVTAMADGQDWLALVNTKPIQTP